MPRPKIERIVIVCAACGESFEERASRGRKYCSRTCSDTAAAQLYASRRITLKCQHCEESFVVYPARRNALYCSLRCKQTAVSRTTARQRADKLRWTGTKTKYIKYRGRHLHRVVAERKLGRRLRTGEVVHHIDGDSWNNDPDNLAIITQAKHLRIHNPRNWYSLQAIEAGEMT